MTNFILTFFRTLRGPSGRGDHIDQDLRKLLEHSLSKFESKQGDQRRIYQINLNIIPVTEPILRDQDHAPVESTEQNKEDVL